MAAELKPLLLDETGKEMRDSIIAISNAIKNTDTVQKAKEEIQAEGATQVANVKAASEEIIGKVEQIDQNTQRIAELKGDLAKLERGSNIEEICHYDNVFPTAIGNHIYKCGTVVIPKGSILKNIKFYSLGSDISYDSYFFVLDNENNIIDKFEISKWDSNSWNTFEINKVYDVDTYIAVTGAKIGYTFSTKEEDNYYSNGFLEAPYTERDYTIGQKLTITNTVTGRWYEFGIEINYYVNGISDLYNNVNERIDTLEDKIPSVKLSDQTMPLFSKTGELGYSLLGRWYYFNTTFKECCNSGGSSIAFKVKGSTKISVSIEQVVNPSHPEYVMSVEPYWACSIDGSDFTRVQVTTGGSAIDIPIPSTDEHLVWIVIDGMCQTSGSANRNSGWSAIHIKSITTDGTMYKVKPKSKQILFVGDSIVEGINTLGTTSTSESKSSVNEFSFRTARKLNCIPLLQGYGGSSSWSGVKYERYSHVDALQDKFLVNNEVDAILIEYGYNDDASIKNGTKTLDDFITNYNLLIDLLRGKYTGVPIICMIPFKQSLSSTIREIASQRSYCYVIETKDYEVEYSDNSHPSTNGAEKIAQRLSEDIVKLLGKSFFM